MNIDFISTVPKVTATLLGFAGAMFVFWYHYRFEELLKEGNKNLLDLFVLSFIFISVSGILTILVSMVELYTLNDNFMNLSSSLFWIFLFSLFGFFVLIIVDGGTERSKIS